MIKENKKRSLFYPSIYPLHSAYKTFLSNPPKGYFFNKNPINKRYRFIFFVKKIYILKIIYKLFRNIFKIDILQNILHKESNIGKENYDFIFSTGSIYYRDSSWVLDIIDNPFCLTGYNYNIFIKNRKKIEKKLLKNNCKAIICSHETSYNFFKKNFPKKILKKTVLIRPGVKFNYIDNLKRINKKNEFQMLFMGSTNNPNDFFIKGGLEALECFKTLRKKYKNVKLIVRCAVPKNVKKQYSLKNIIFIEERISFEDLQNLYLDSDVLLMPGHTYFLMAFLEAMSFGLPIIALDTYAVKDYLEDNKNAFLIKPSKNIPYNDPSYPTNIRSKKFINTIKKIDKRVINDLSEKIEILINNPSLKEKMSKESLKIVKTKFSIQKRNKELKKLFDKILK